MLIELENGTCVPHDGIIVKPCENNDFTFIVFPMTDPGVRAVCEITAREKDVLLALSAAIEHDTEFVFSKTLFPRTRDWDVERNKTGDHLYFRYGKVLAEKLGISYDIDLCPWLKEQVEAAADSGCDYNFRGWVLRILDSLYLDKEFTERFVTDKAAFRLDYHGVSLRNEMARLLEHWDDIMLDLPF